MAFDKKTWSDRMVEYAGRRKLTNITTKQAIICDIERSEGTVSQEGDAFSSQNMNDLEQRIEDGFTEVKQTTDTLNQNLAQGKIQFDVRDGKGFYRAVGADTWLPFSNTKVPLYKNGNEYVALTGGWVAGNFHGGIFGESGITATITKYSTNIQMAISAASRQGQLYTANLIDVSDYQLLRAKITDNTYGSYIAFGLFTESGLKYTWAKYIPLTGSNDSFTIDITNLTGSYYIGIAGVRFSNNNPIVTITDVWLEKE